jgi:hypothetical protein
MHDVVGVRGQTREQTIIFLFFKPIYSCLYTGKVQIQGYIKAILEWRCTMPFLELQKKSAMPVKIFSNFLSSSCIQITPSFTKQDRTTLLHLQLVSKSQFCPKKSPKDHLDIWICRENIAAAGRGALFASKCPFLKEGTMSF